MKKGLQISKRSWVVEIMRKIIAISLTFIILLILYIGLSKSVIISSQIGKDMDYVKNKYVDNSMQYEIYSINVSNNSFLLPVRLKDVSTDDTNNFLNLVEALDTNRILHISIKDDVELSSLRANNEIRPFHEILIKAKKDYDLGLLLKVNKSISPVAENLRPSKIKVKYSILGIPFSKTININIG